MRECVSIYLGTWRIYLFMCGTHIFYVCGIAVCVRGCCVYLFAFACVWCISVCIYLFVWLFVCVRVRDVYIFRACYICVCVRAK